MLVAGLGAGVALADEPEAAQQTQSETMQQGSEGQQPATETGDVADETNTNADDQTDPSQGADGDEGADVEPGDGDSEESDQTQESEADKADGDQPQNDADNGQSAEKQSAQVPAPLAANAAEPRASTSTFDTPSTKEDVHVKLFDYDAGQKGKNSDDQINANHTLKFGTEGAFNGSQANSWTGYRNGVRQGLVKKDLQDGYPVLTKNNTLGTNGESLKYLFDPQSTNRHVHVQAGGEDVDGLFQKDKNGYYHYDSRFNFAKYDESNKSFQLYDSGRITEICTPSWYTRCTGSGIDSNYKVLQEGDPLPGGTNDAAFLPFNDIDPSDDSRQFTYNQNNLQYYWHGYSLASGQSANYSFGMTVETQFYMPRDGMVNGNDMVFEFSGDDDVWVFVDDKLVLDLGGIHDDFGGSINFADGTATVDKVADENNGDPVTTKLDKILRNGWDEFGSTHTLKVFYLERGAGGSNCKFRFNLPTISADSINVGKEITDSNTAAFTTAQFKMRVDIDYNGDGDHSNAEPYVGSYDVFDTDTNQFVETRNTDNQGVITIGHGQYARLKSDQFDQDTWYKVTELSAENYDKNDYKFELSNASLVDDEGGDQTSNEIGSSVWVQAIKTNFLIVRNRFIAADKYSFTVSKVMAGGQTSTEKFNLLVTNENGEPYKGDYFLNGASEKKITVNGVIQLQAGQSAKIMDVDPGTTFKVQETDVPAGFLTPTYQCVAGAESSNEPCTVMTSDKDNNQNPAITVTNTPATAYAGVDIVKTLVGRPWSDSDEFTFQVTPNDPSYPLPDNVDANGRVTVTKANDEYQGNEATRVVDLRFDALPYLGSDTTYGYTVTEVAGSADGIVYSKARWHLAITVRCGEDGTVESGVVVQKVLDDDGNSPTISTNAIIQPMTFTNRFISVSSLPLTGGRSTARTLLLAGGGVLLVAGAAWLLARRRRV